MHCSLGHEELPGQDLGYCVADSANCVDVTLGGPVKKLIVLALAAALLTGACGNLPYAEVTPNFSGTTYIAVESPEGAVAEDDDLFDTSCSNPGHIIGESVEGSLEAAIAYAYSEEIGVVHLCAGEYVTTDVVEFENLGSITIEGDGSNKTIVRASLDHSLFAMIPAECMPEDVEGCPSYFNVLTIKDLSLRDGVGGAPAFELSCESLSDDCDADPDPTTFLAGGAVTAPLVRTERVRFENNSGVCGGAISTYGWTMTLTDQFFTDGDGGFDSETEALEYLLGLVEDNTNEIVETTFAYNSASVGGAIAGIANDSDGGEDACLLTGPLRIADSGFHHNLAETGDSLEASIGGAIAGADLFLIVLLGLGGDLEEIEDTFGSFYRAGGLQISNSAFTDNKAVGDGAQGGAVFYVGNLSIDQSAFTNNHAISTADLPAYGGAIALGGALSLENSTLVGNTSDSGGAVAFPVLFPPSTFVNSTVSRNTFTRNIAADQGGAIAGWPTDGIARGNRFSSNRASTGPAVAVPIQNCTRTWSRRAVRDWRGNTFRQNRGGRLPVECYVAAPEPT